MDERQNKPSFAIWCAVTIVCVPLLYPLSFGPACKLVGRDVLPRQATFWFYRPLPHNPAEGGWPMWPYAKLLGIHPVSLHVQDAVLDLEDEKKAARVNHPAETPDAWSESGRPPAR